MSNDIWVPSAPASLTLTYVGRDGRAYAHRTFSMEELCLAQHPQDMVWSAIRTLLRTVAVQS
jgi:hypothetical protein